MTVKELIEKLSSLPQNHSVILSSDAEGNSFTAAYVLEECFAIKSGYGYELPDAEDCEEEEFPGDNCVILWPT